MLFVLLLGLALAHDTVYPVTAGSTVTLANIGRAGTLNSHIITYGSGSNGQSVTLFNDPDADRTNFVVLPLDSDKLGYGVKCGDKIALFHSDTGKYVVVSKDFRSPFDSGLEVSAVQARKVPKNGIFEVQCADNWETDTAVKLLNTATKTYLTATGNTYTDPIRGQGEISAIDGSHKPASQQLWTVWGGYLVDEPL